MKYSEDWHLMIIVLIFIATDVIILVVAESVQASRFVPTLREDREFPNTITVRLCTVFMHGFTDFLNTSARVHSHSEAIISLDERRSIMGHILLLNKTFK